MVLGLMRRPDGVTLAEIASITGWQNILFALSTLAKDRQLKIVSTKNVVDVRVYTL